MCKLAGYPVEEISCTTKDGYILRIHRIPHGTSKESQIFKKKPVIFLQHGLEASSCTFTSNEPHQSAAFMFADTGFDVFLGNFRGNVYSRQHTTLKNTDKEFWNFSFDQMIKYDLDAMIDKALEVTGEESLYYVGHSQGTLTMFGKLATDPSFAPKIRWFFALAPICTAKYIKGTLRVLSTLAKPSESLLFYFKEGKMFPRAKWLKTLTEKAVKVWLFNKIALSSVYQLVGPNSNQLNESRFPIYVKQMLQGTSSKNWQHYLQLVYSGQFQMFDNRNKTKNIEMYGQEKPPVYDISNVNTPIVLFWSEKDFLSTEKDLNESIIPNLRADIIKASYKLPKFNHMDYIWGNKAGNKIYKPIIETVWGDWSAQKGRQS
uniref:Lipase n=1 Tax=Rhabditophanes sp. KR3021 TaxID=114890 RepID=A0AC35TFS8_9BILA